MLILEQKKRVNIASKLFIYYKVICYSTHNKLIIIKYSSLLQSNALLSLHNASGGTAPGKLLQVQLDRVLQSQVSRRRRADSPNRVRHPGSALVLPRLGDMLPGAASNNTASLRGVHQNETAEDGARKAAVRWQGLQNLLQSG